ncbi:MAG: hypothetical protein ACXWKP_07500 [Bradyrhizobium sp.]
MEIRNGGLFKYPIDQGMIVKSQTSTTAKIARKPSGAILAVRYLALQRLRDEVRKAEIRRLKKPRDRT